MEEYRTLSKNLKTIERTSEGISLEETKVVSVEEGLLWPSSSISCYDQIPETKLPGLLF